MLESLAAPAALQLVVGLGNPGEKYGGTRHNVGFMALERMAAAAQVGFRNQAKLHGLLAEVGQGSSRLRLLMPQTYMNESGRSIRAALDWFGLEPSQLLVVVDDMDLPLGKLRLRASGSAGGHNGLRSAISHLGTQGHVLGRFESQEHKLLEAVFAEVEAGIDLLQRLGLERAGNRLNSFQPELASA
jgi:peptidyl-tRNA hydrolase, PTH1 family